MSKITYDSDITYNSDTTYDGDAVLPDSIFLGDVPVKLYLGGFTCFGRDFSRGEVNAWYGIYANKSGVA